MSTKSLTPGRISYRSGGSSSSSSSSGHYPTSANRRSSLPIMTSTSPMPFRSPIPTPITNRVVMEIVTITLSTTAITQNSAVSMALFCTLKILNHTTSFKSNYMDSNPRSSVTTYKFPSPWNRIEQILHRSSSPMAQLVILSESQDGELIGEGLGAVIFSTAADFQGNGILNIMKNGHKIGEAKYITYHPMEGFLDDSASEDGDQASATPSPLITNSTLHLTPGRIHETRMNLSFQPEINHEPNEDDEQEKQDDAQEDVLTLSPRMTRSGLVYDGSGHKRSKGPRTPMTPIPTDEEINEIFQQNIERNEERVPTSSVNTVLLVLVIAQMIALSIICFLFFNQAKALNLAAQTPEVVALPVAQCPQIESAQPEPLPVPALKEASSPPLLVKKVEEATAPAQVVSPLQSTESNKLPLEIIATIPKQNQVQIQQETSYFPENNENVKLKLSDNTNMMAQLIVASYPNSCIQWKVSMTGGKLAVESCDEVESFWQIVSQKDDRNSFSLLHLKSQKCLDYSHLIHHKDAAHGKLALANCEKASTYWQYHNFHLLPNIDEEIKFSVTTDNKSRQKVELIRMENIEDVSSNSIVDVKLQMQVVTKEKVSATTSTDGNNDALIASSKTKDYYSIHTAIIEDLVF